MKTVYFKDGSGRKVYAEVTDEVAIELKATRNAIWNNDAYERYHCVASLDAMTDRDRRTSCADSNPESIYIANEECVELRKKLFAALKTLTPEQVMLVSMLKKRLSITDIAATLGVSKSAVSNMRIRIQVRIKKYLK